MNSELIFYVIDKPVTCILVSKNYRYVCRLLNPTVIYPLETKLKQRVNIRFRTLINLDSMFDYFKLEKNAEFHQMPFRNL